MAAKFIKWDKGKYINFNCIDMMEAELDEGQVQGGGVLVLYNGDVTVCRRMFIAEDGYERALTCEEAILSCKEEIFDLVKFIKDNGWKQKWEE